LAATAEALSNVVKASGDGLNGSAVADGDFAEMM